MLTNRGGRTVHRAPIAAIALAFAVSAAATAQVPGPAGAQPVVDARTLLQRPGQPIALNAGIGRVVQLPRAAASVFAADPTVAEVRAASPTTLFILGTGPGRTTVAALDGAGSPIAQFEVTVRPSAYGASEAQAAIARALPGRRIRVEQRGDGLVVLGDVGNASEAEQVVRIARGYVGPTGVAAGAAAGTATGVATGTVDNRLVILGQTQVTLRVRIAEVSRQVTRELGIDWTNLGTIGRLAIGATTATGFGSTTANLIRGTFAGNGFNLDALISALAEDQLARVLAEPTLTALSGESASFLVGGEFPIPIAGGGGNNNTVTVTYRSFGISLAFVPTVLSQGRIMLRVRPEVSEISDVGAFTISNGTSGTSTTVPGLTIRRAETTVEVGSGQSFAIAGLLSDTSRRSSRALPWLGEIPIIGALLRSDRFQRNETELVIIITPYLVRPISDPSALREPTAAAPIPDDVDRWLLLRQVARTRGRPPNMPGEAGFSLP